VATALYRRYRPETFADVIGQAHVTEPLMTALRSNRVNHAYLFSGPRGCGKTTSARILARCLNCAQGPTDTPCGVCPSCVELSRDGGGSLDVVEIDAASHNGVDDARDLRERAIFAPARDRYKIFILDEAHMVTPQGFNALLKLVEEPPEHVKFIFATTEPEKVIGTIRSRTHHYPFRLIPPAQMLEYTEQLCTAEGITVEPGVLGLVVRAGGGSARDTLSLLDQLMAGSENNSVTYERAVALLGYTHSALLDDAIDALSAHDAAACFSVVDRVIHTGQDPRRFVEDLLERLRDLIVVEATGLGAQAVLRGVPEDELDRMRLQAASLGAAELSRAADVVNSALTEMTGATSPRLHLELLMARLLVRATAVDAQPAPRVAPQVSAPAAVPAAAPAPKVAPAPAPAPEPVPTPAPAPEPRLLTGDELRAAWPQIVASVRNANAVAGQVVGAASMRSLEGDVLTLVFTTADDAAAFRPVPGIPGGVHEILRQVILEATGIRVQFKMSTEFTATEPIERVAVPDEPPFNPSLAPTDDDWAVVEVPGSGPQWATPLEPTVEAPVAAPTPREPEVEAEAEAEAEAAPGMTPEEAEFNERRYGESVVREILGARFIGEETLASPSSGSAADAGIPPTDNTLREA
jgi:DNA polymerase-3 subunit gamma/tau